MKIKLPSRKNRTAPKFSPMTTERFIKELPYPWSAEVDNRGMLHLSHHNREIASYVQGSDDWLFSDKTGRSIEGIDIQLMQRMLALAEYEHAGKKYVLVNGKPEIGTRGKYWHIFILGANGLETTLAFEDELQEYAYSKEELEERTVNRYPIELWHAIGSLAVPLDELLAEENDYD
ncbi:hypothetical protein [Lactobacillus equicursoris]|nr:hypothetical protein [Lactobacillus equicursoris]